MKARASVLAIALAGVAAGCVPAGGSGGGGSFGGGGGFAGNPDQIVGQELDRLLADGSVFIDWNDGYAECGFFGRDGWYEYDAYYRERGIYYYDYSDGENWYVQGDRVCIGSDCFYAEWSNDSTVYFSSVSGGFAGYAEIIDGPGYFYQDACGFE